MDKRILEALRDKPLGLTLPLLIKGLRIGRKERAKFEDRLRDLENRGLVRRVRDRYKLPLQSGLIRGGFTTSGRGYGFVAPESGGEDVFIPGRFAGGAIQGDFVEVLYRERGLKGLPEGKIIRVLRKGKKELIGLYAERAGRPFIAPLETPFGDDIPLASRGGLFPALGDIVTADRGSLVLTEVLGAPETPGVDVRVVIRKYGLAAAFPPAVLAAAEAEACRPIDEEARAKGRVDHRGWTTVTIDGESAQDFDDAVSVRELEGGGWRLGVHIADVSHYVRPGTGLESEAAARATSVYFPGLTLPMLPERLSNDLCSLRPRLDRLTVSAVMEIAPDGRVVGAEFHPSVIRTADRLTYTSVFKVFEGDREERRRLAPLVPDLMAMRDLARALRRRRLEQGSLDFDLVEPELVYSEGRLQSVAAFAPNEAHKLIEDFMVTANVAVASYLAERGIASIFRVHPRPAEADLEKLRETLAAFGISLPKPDRITSFDLQAAVRAAEGTPAEKFVNVRILRSLRLATYTTENVGHYGLAQAEYTHFTSPIRRYPDLAVHRILKAALSGGETKVPGLEAAARRSSEQERKADEAEKDLVEWRIFRFLKARLGDEFGGIVTDITRSGLVVEIDDYFVSGLLAFSDLGREEFRPRSRGVTSGRRTGRKYQLGERLRVVLAAVDPMLRRMTLVLP